MATQEFLSFVLDEDEYGVPILDVREVRGWNDVRAVPNSPDYMVGVLDIRGEYVPIVDLRMRFHLPAAQITATTVVVVLNDIEKHPLGLIVDGVAEVYELNPEQIKPAPHLSSVAKQKFIKGIAAVKSGHLILIDIESLFNVTELNHHTIEEAIM
ncbi:chemotaxis protein CheW [Vibrio fluvialis]|uniref:Chemotaxis protein CheW n=1 Tax=Vibrio fluvialis TaxID=676 RepID=A0AAX2LUZ4_VIBFL|nr:chemotaxis protein CheW [Vibrio fluvialis]AMF93303.1 chemotaxis protein CheW [Vibrio fluvialis]EKO4011458.1 chemotaxis protein CheW [Vibrio fluvialis]MBY8229540.1 chemotaxis protein CheW [Vibrio fluvialis]MCE7633312.1 chemotaxis protein CheW [Vibrio fluvialis]SUQ26684.1 Chemotaxis signal transduction protein [Vibrio fluvialis]